MRTGRCKCDSVNYQFSGEPLTCYACHCTDCQTLTGSAFTLSMIARRSDINILKGELSINSYIQNGAEIKRFHCGECGTALWYGADVMPEFCAIKPGTFDDNTWFRPIAHLWTRSAQSWLTFEPEIKIFEKQPEMSELIALWANKE